MYATSDDEEVEEVDDSPLQFPVGRHIVTGELARRLWEDLVHQGPHNSQLSTSEVHEEISHLQSMDYQAFSNEQQVSTLSVIALCNRLSQAGEEFVNVSTQTFNLNSSSIPLSVRMPESVQGVKFWPTPDTWLKVVKQRSQQRNFYSNNFSDAYSLEVPHRSVTACSVPCREFELIGGTIILGEEGCIVLSGRGENDMEACKQQMQYTTIQGGCVVCCGSRCQAAFRNVSFVNCSVVAVHGAQVTLQDCSFTWEGSSKSSGIGIFAKGANTNVQVTGGMFRGGKQGAAVTEGAGFIADSWKLRKVVSSHNPGSMLLMRTVSFDNIDTAMRSCHALLVTVESIAEVVERTFSVSATACRAKACLQRCKVSEASGNGVAVLGEEEGAEELQMSECIVSEGSSSED